MGSYETIKQASDKVKDVAVGAGLGSLLGASTAVATDVDAAVAKLKRRVNVLGRKKAFKLGIPLELSKKKAVAGVILGGLLGGLVAKKIKEE